MAPELFSVTGHPNATNWNMEQGYNDKMVGESSLKFYPHRVIGTGPTNGLTILLHLDLEHVDYFGQIPIRGFKVILHAPLEIPQSTKNFFIVSLCHFITYSTKHLNSVQCLTVLLRRACMYKSMYTRAVSALSNTIFCLANISKIYYVRM